MRKKYASRLTKERLLQEGFTEVTKEGRLFKGNREVFPHWQGKEANPNRYLCIQIYQRDSEGHLIKGKTRKYKYTRKDGSVGESISWQAKSDIIGLHRLMWAWFYGEVPEGFVVDHINNQHLKIEDYHLDNLQLLTPKENITKERICNVKEIECKLNKPRTFYEDKLKRYEAEYEKAKLNKDAKAAQKLRTNLAQTRARLRYYDAHIEEAEELIKAKEEAKLQKLNKKASLKDRKLLEQYKLMFKEAGNKPMWHELNKVIKLWDTLTDLQKNHVFDNLHNLFRR